MDLSEGQTRVRQDGPVGYNELFCHATFPFACVKTTGLSAVFVRLSWLVRGEYGSNVDLDGSP